MTRRGQLFVLLTVLSSILIIGGCGTKEKKKAQAEAAAAKLELEKTKAQLQKTVAERDNLAAELKKLIETYTALTADSNTLKASLEDTKAQLATVTKTRNNLQQQISALQGTVQKMQETAKEAEPTLYRVVFTTALTEDNVPVNDLKEIPITEKKFYVFIKWRLSVAEHTYEIKIFDGSGKLTSDNPVKFTPQTIISNTWFEYAVNKYIDQPGKWKFEIYLDGKKMAEEYLNVPPDQPRSKN